MGTATRGAPLLLAVLGTVDPTTAFGHGSVAEPEAFDDDDTSRSMYGRAAAYGGVDARSFDQALYLGRSETYEEEGYDYDVDYALYGRHKHDYSYTRLLTWRAAAERTSTNTTTGYFHTISRLNSKPPGQGATIGSGTGREAATTSEHGVDAGTAAAELTLGQLMLQIADTEYESREQTAATATSLLRRTSRQLRRDSMP